MGTYSKFNCVELIARMKTVSHKFCNFIFRPRRYAGPIFGLPASC